MTSTGWYVVVVAAVAVERLIELIVSKRHERVMRARGGREFGASHYPAMVALHSALLVGCLAEVALADRSFVPWLGVTMMVVVVASQALRWWCITTLGVQWTTRVLVSPDVPLVTGGPYRWFRHPNYVAVVAEGAALPLVHGSWVTATSFTVLNAVLLRARIRVENAALTEAATARTTPVGGRDA